VLRFGLADHELPWFLRGGEQKKLGRGGLGIRVSKNDWSANANQEKKAKEPLKGNSPENGKSLKRGGRVQGGGDRRAASKKGDYESWES